MKPAARGLGATLVATAALVAVMVLVVRKGLIGGLFVVLLAVVGLFIVTALAVIFGKKKDG